MIMGIDLSAITDPQFNAYMDYAAKQYVARAVDEMLAGNPDLTVAELHQALVEKIELARRVNGN
ncbi:hypothetical protein [Leucobacter tenebrionis]|uniref:hypothetical protein n=1 Tax=Leucobacter tenebrionis TaxID=2873270 RepID=UPI001CA6D451|nr:hypothetical protein [Leucobacter tenebrionis]QZY51333.1 hypothetical protein KVY00_12195 [Leucobacter tenebrionis]